MNYLWCSKKKLMKDSELLHFFSEVLEMTATQETIRFSGHTLDKATKAKVTLENYYSNLIAQHIERKQRYVIVK